MTLALIVLRKIALIERLAALRIAFHNAIFVGPAKRVTNTYLQTLWFGFLLWLCAGLGSALAQTQSPNVEKLRLWHSPSSTRVVFDVSADVKHTVFSLRNPERIVVDINDSSLTATLPELDSANAHIAAIRTGQPQPGVLRFVFELKTKVKQTNFVLSPNELYGHRLVLDLEDHAKARSDANSAQPSRAPIDPAVALRSAQPVPSVSTPPGASDTQLAQQARSVKSAPAAKFKPLVVAIDAGHGGEDPGAIGHRGTHEKKLTLAIAKRLKKVVDADPRMQATLVRTGDYYIKLHKRRLLARDEKGADIFISIHADAFAKKSARGFSVFALSQRGATSAMASALAAKENASDSIGGVSLADKDEVLAKVLVDLSMTNTISESVNLGGRVLNELSKLGRLHSKRVEQAGFAVLKTPDMPSILVETGFITNPQEERNLRSSAYQQKIAQAIYTAIDQYAKQTPYFTKGNYAAPRLGSSRSAATDRTNAKPRYHTVRRGDSLSKIAQRYGVSVTALKKANKLRSNVAVLGRKLTIPGGATTLSAVKKQQRPLIHVVKRGDSLSKISARYNVTIKSLRRLNKLDKDTVFLGQKIKLPAGGQRIVTKAKPTIIKHKVVRGDTLSEIAEKYRSSIKAIMRANNMRSRTVRLGQVLKIPS